ncbi:MAG TPA: hypothetical protein VHU88_02070 [Sporichthyaceae bacterium]|nr:hypothetical protein [Sporichthyaceae bacterium]
MDGGTPVSGFDRIKPRSGEPAVRRRTPMPAPRGDTEGKRALFSQPAPGPAPIPFGALVLTCSKCGATTAMTAVQVLTAAIPSFHLPIIRRHYPSWMRCPACERRTWVRVSARRR